MGASFPENRERLTKILKIFAVGLLLTATIWFGFKYYYLLLGDDARIDKVVVQSNRFLTRTEIANMLGFRPGVKVSAINIKKIEELLELNPRIKSAVVYLNYPDLIVKVTERIAVAIINNGHGLFEVDREMNALSENQVKDTGLICITVEFELTTLNSPVAKLVNDTFTQKKIQELKKMIIGLNYLKKKYSEVFSWISEFIISKSKRIRAVIAGRFLTVDFGYAVSEKQLRKLSTSLSYFMKNNLNPAYLDLSGPDGIYK